MVIHRLLNRYNTLQKDSAVQHCVKQLLNYRELLQCTKRNDYSISLHIAKEHNNFDHYYTIFSDLFRVIVEGFLALPGLLLLLPTFIIGTVYSKHYQWTALKRSTVKITAIDVLATGKLISATVCLLLCMLFEPLIIHTLCASRGFDVTVLDDLCIFTFLPWVFYATIFLAGGFGEKD